MLVIFLIVTRLREFSLFTKYNTNFLDEFRGFTKFVDIIDFKFFLFFLKFRVTVKVTEKKEKTDFLG